MSKLDEHFKFKIGQSVYLKTEVDHYNAVWKPLLEQKKRDYIAIGDMEVIARTPTALMIQERMLQECHGGIQMHYRIRRGFANEIVTMTEPELTDVL